MINILYAGKPEEYESYKTYVSSGLSENEIAHSITDQTNTPAAIDYIIYAPNSWLQDFTDFTNVKLVQNLWAGVETVAPNKTLTQPLARMVEPGLNQGMIEYVTGHVLRHHLGTDFYAAQDPGVWRDDVVPPLAQDRHVAVLGLGALGHSCALALANLGFNVMGWSRGLKTSSAYSCHAGTDGLTHVLGSADILVLLLPNTPQTKHIISTNTIAKMKRGMSIINPGRGTLINDDALLSGLDDGTISDVTLDVFHTEPLPKDHPYWTHPNVLVTPHIASATRTETAAQTVVENIVHGETGEPFHHLVDRDLGY